MKKNKKKYVVLMVTILVALTGATLVGIAAARKKIGVLQEQNKANVVGEVTTNLEEQETEGKLEEGSKKQSGELSEEKLEEVEKLDVPSGEDSIYTYTEQALKMYATTIVNVRNQPETTGTILKKLVTNQEVQVTGVCNETSWYRIEIEDGVGYVSNNYLSKEIVAIVEEVAEDDIQEEPEKIEESQNLKFDTGDEQLNNQCDAILKEILTENMSTTNQLWAVYQWVTTSIRYKGGTPIVNWAEVAKTAFDERSGNCYAFCCTSKALLTRLGYHIQIVERSDQEHYWDLVQVNGNWYHFDATPGWGATRFMWTDEQMLSYSYEYDSGHYLEYFWDQSKYPATPKKNYN